MDIREKSALGLAEMLKNKEATSIELTTILLDAIEEENSDTNAFISVDREKALTAAKKADELIASGKGSTLTGVPVAIKDNINMKDTITSAGSKMLSGYTSPYSATVVERMEHAGMVIIGKTNLDEFAVGTTGESSFYGASKNIWNKDHTAGGSSSGSGAAVAALQTPLALGSDTGGSVRLPAANCGIVGFKPSYGGVSRYGVISVASSMDQVGIMGRSVSDVLELYSVISGHDPKDATTTYNTFRNIATKGLKGLKIGIPTSDFDADSEVGRSVMQAVELFKQAGAVVTEITSSTIEHGLSAYYILSSAEISSNMGRYDGVRFGFRAENHSDNYEDMFIKTRSQGFGSSLQKRILLGTHFLSAKQYDEYYIRATAVREQVKKEFAGWFSGLDVIITPTSPTTAIKAGNGDKTDEIFKYDKFTAPANLADLPAISLPCGIGENNLPIGMQIIGNKYADNLVLAVAEQYEKLVGGFPTYKAGGAK